MDAEYSSSGGERAYLPEHHRPVPPHTSGSNGKHNVLTHSSKDPHCEICKRTKITRAPYRRRTKIDIPRAEWFSDLITADHEVLIEEGESCNNHRYTDVVQDLAIQWIQSYPCKTKTAHNTVRSSQKFLDPEAISKVIYADNALELGKACEHL